MTRIRCERPIEQERPRLWCEATAGNNAEIVDDLQVLDTRIRIALLPGINIVSVDAAICRNLLTRAPASRAEDFHLGLGWLSMQHITGH